MATLNGKTLTAKQLATWKRKIAKEDKAFWDKEAKKISLQISTLKKQLPAAKKLPIKVKATSIQIRIKDLESQLKRIKRK